MYKDASKRVARGGVHYIKKPLNLGTILKRVVVQSTDKELNVGKRAVVCTKSKCARTNILQFLKYIE